MEIRDFRYFCITAELEHVTKAAEQLGVSQPFLTRIIGQIEKELGTPLFDNVGRKIKLNAFGEVFYGLAKKAVAEFDKVLEEMDRLLDRHENSLTILANSEGYSAEITMAYNLAHPDHTITSYYASKKDIIDKLVSGDGDFALCAPPIREDPLKNIVTLDVFREYGVVLLPPEHPLLSKDLVELADLADMPMIASLKGSGMRISMEEALDKYSFHPKIACETNDPSLIIKMVANGMGFAFLPRSNMLLNSQLRPFCRPMNIPEDNDILGLSYNKNISSNKNAEDFIKFIQDYFARREKAVAEILS
ncbi:MAG: LysR family transcriptional regulator [Oscillospiraceae bacterium]